MMYTVSQHTLYVKSCTFSFIVINEAAKEGNNQCYQGYDIQNTVKSRASVHGCSQLKPKKLGVGPYTENMLERLNYLLASAHPRLPNILRRSHNLQVCTA